MFKKSPIVTIPVFWMATVCWVFPLLAQSPVETILVNGKIVTVDATFSYQEALAIADGRIVALGSSEEIEKLAGPNTRRVDLGGKTVIPGLADNHLHSIGGGPGVGSLRDENSSGIAASHFHPSQAVGVRGVGRDQLELT